MKDFENVDRYYWSADASGEDPEGDWVMYSDYKDLLDAYKEFLWMREELEK